MKRVRIEHRSSGQLIADGPLGWGITPFEGNLYVRRKYLKAGRFRVNFLPGLCVYKFLYVWLDYLPDTAPRERNLGWMYWLPNPLFPFIWFRVAVPRTHPSLCIEEYESSGDGPG